MEYVVYLIEQNGQYLLVMIEFEEFLVYYQQAILAKVLFFHVYVPSIYKIVPEYQTK